MKNPFSKVKQLIKKRLEEILLNLLKDIESTGLLYILLSSKKTYDNQRLALNAYGTLVSGFSASMRPRSQINRIAVFGVLPPEKTGIAYFNAQTFGINNSFNVFSNMKALKDFTVAGNISGLEYKNNFFFIEAYDILKMQINYGAKIFILGNSEHHIPYLRQAIIEPDKQHSWLYFHDIKVMDFICYFLLLDIVAIKDIFCKVYPEFAAKIINLNTLNDLMSFFEENKRCGIKVIVYLTGITKVIINNDFAQQLAEYDFLGENIETTKLFLPIANLNDVSYKKLDVDSNIFLIGSFGLPSDKYKATDTVIGAVSILNQEYNISAKCIIAGYHVDKYYQSLTRNLRNLVIPFSDMSEKELFSIMKSVHMAVQLRNVRRGESSGVVSLLLGMNKKIITTENFIDFELEKYCGLVPRFVTQEALAEAIIKEMQINRNMNNNLLLEKYSFQSLSDTILSMCDYNTTN